LCTLEEKGLIETKNVIEFSGRGSLWITYQYIEKGLLDLVQADLEQAVASRDFYGPLFENTELALARLFELQEHERALSIYKLAITHRLKAIKGEIATVRKTEKGKNAHGASKKWIKHHAPPLKRLVDQYETLLEKYGVNDPDLGAIRQTLLAL
jgi:hypothetical protein